MAQAALVTDSGRGSADCTGGTQEPVSTTSIKCVGECVGTFLLVLFGCGAVHSAVLTGALNGLWQVAIVWGVSIMLACYLVGSISGAHINPAITLAFAVWGRFSWRLVAPYILAQVVGASGPGLLHRVHSRPLPWRGDWSRSLLPPVQ